MAWRDQILAGLEIVFEAWLSPAHTPPRIRSRGSLCFRIVKDAESFFSHSRPYKAPAVIEMAEALRVPQRRFFHAFRNWLGIGPHEYLQLIRLHRLRHLLLAASPSNASVTSLAINVGFKHMGHPSVAYRKFFEESPRETLRRR